MRQNNISEGGFFELETIIIAFVRKRKSSTAINIEMIREENTQTNPASLLLYSLG